MSERKVTFTKTYQVQAANGEKYEEGKEYTLNEDSAAHFISRGIAVDSKDYKPATDDGDNHGDEDVTIDEIVEAIKLLDPDKPGDYTQGGKPDVKALEAILEKDITAAQRDEAFAKFQAE